MGERLNSIKYAIVDILDDFDGVTWAIRYLGRVGDCPVDTSTGTQPIDLERSVLFWRRARPLHFPVNRAYH